MGENSVVLLTGATGAIGASLLEQLVADHTHVYATYRAQPGPQHPRVTWITLDLLQQGSMDAVVNTLTAQVERLDGFLCASGALHGEWGQPEKSIIQIDPTAMHTLLQINATGPLQLFARCAKLLRKSPQPRALFLSAQIGSIEDNLTGGWISYRMAKAALNMGVKTASIEAARWRNQAAVVAVHPGTTHSNLSAPFVARRTQPVSTAAATGARLYQLFQNLDSGDNGGFLTSTGERLPW